MTTGSFWDITTNSKKPTGEIDKNDILDIPWDWAEWLADAGTAITIATFTATPTSPMRVVTSSIINSGTGVLVRVAVDLGVYDASLNLNQKYPVLLHIVASDGQEKDQSLWFKIVEH